MAVKVAAGILSVSLIALDIHGESPGFRLNQLQIFVNLEWLCISPLTVVEDQQSELSFVCPKLAQVKLCPAWDDVLCWHDLGSIVSSTQYFLNRRKFPSLKFLEYDCRDYDIGSPYEEVAEVQEKMDNLEEVFRNADVRFKIVRARPHTS